MPIFNPFDDEERKRRLLLTPGINPDAPVSLPRPPWTPGAVTAMGGDVMVPEKPAGLPGDMRGNPPLAAGPGRPSSLPEIPNLSRPINAARPELDMTGAPSIIPRPQTRYGELQEAKDVYLQKTPGRGKSALLGVLQGLGQGLASGGGLGAGLGGALAGGVVGGVNPRGLREQQFNQQVKPKILERFQYEDADRAQQAAAQKAQREDQAARAGILNTQSQIQERTNAGALAGRKQTFEENKPTVLAPGASIVPPGANRPSFTAPERTTPPKAPTAAELATDPESGMSWEEMADASYEARGGDQDVFNRLPARTKQLLDKGTITNAEGKELTADPAEVRAAERSYQTAINRQRQTDKEYSRGAVRSRRLGGAQNATSPGLPKGGKKAATQSGPRNLKDLTSLWK